MWALAYQVPFSLRLPIGGDSETHRRKDDAPFLAGFHAPEPDDDKSWALLVPVASDAHAGLQWRAATARWPWWLLSPGYAYRWTRPEAAVHLPGIGGGRWIVALHAGSGRPAEIPAISTWQIGDQPPLQIVLPSSSRVYHLLAASDAAGDLTINLHTIPYATTDDPRELGFALREVRVVPATDGPRWPALAQAGWLAATLMLCYGLARWLVLDVRPALLLALAYAVLVALLLACQRLALTVFSPKLAGLALGCWALALLIWLAVGGWQSGGRDWSPVGAIAGRPRLLAAHRQFGAVVALLLLAFALRAGGMLHPHAIFSDHRLHANNLLELALGKVYFVEGLPASRGGGHAPYPPGLYLLLAPALTLFPTDINSRVLIMQPGVALLDSLVLVLIWLLLRRAQMGQRAAVLGAALYLLPPPLMASFSIGEYGNLGGQILALPIVALLAWGGARPRDSFSLVPLVLFAALLCLGLLGHMGVAISLVLLLLCAWGLSLYWWLVRRFRSRASADQPLPFALPILTGGGMLAAAFVGLFYYSAPLFSALYGQRLASDTTQNALPSASLLSLPGAIVAELFAPGGRLLPLTVAIGIAGALLLWQHRQRGVGAAGLSATLLAWWLGTLLSFALLLMAQQGVRWQHFLYPALCLGGGAALHAFWRRGNIGRCVALLCLAAIISHGLLLWVWQVYDYLH